MLKLKRLVLALACPAVAVLGHAAEFTDPLQKPAPAIGALVKTARLTAVTQADKRLVAVGPRGLVLLSDDQGNSWKQSMIGLSSDLVQVRFRTAQQGWAVGHDGVILQTTDGGGTWNKVLDGFQAASLIEKHYAAATDLSAEQRGEIQRMVEDGADKPFFDVLFVSELEGFAVGAFNLVMRTTDGGKTWVPLIDRTNNPMGYHLYALAMRGQELYAVGERGMIRRWNKDKAVFDAVHSPYEGSFFGLLGKGNSLFAFGLQGNAFRSNDAGATWTKLQGIGHVTISAATAMPDGRLVLVNMGGKVLVSADDGASFKEVTGKRPMPLYGVAPADASHVLVVGRNGVDTVALP